MFLGLKDFDIDLFLKLDDENIYIQYNDLRSMPSLQNFVPLGSFDDEGKLMLKSLPMSDRNLIGREFLLRDGYAEILDSSNTAYIRIDLFLEQFGNIPEVVEFFDKFIAKCESDTPPEWCTNCQQDSSCPDYWDQEFDYTATRVPETEFTEDEFYYIVILYFNGIYRVSPQNAQDFGTYQVLTDINFDLNYYSLIINIKDFFTYEFINFLKTIPGSTPFSNDYGSEIKTSIQTKNFMVKQRQIENEINFFIKNFNEIYGELVVIQDIVIQNYDSNIGADEWLIEVHATVKKERLVYRIEV